MKGIWTSLLINNQTGAEPKTAESSLTNRGGRQRFMGKIQSMNHKIRW